MPSERVNGAILERCCVQFSHEVPPVAPQAALQHTSAFLRAYVKDYPFECASALVYRVVESAPKSDRLGAWLQLNEAIALALKEIRPSHAAGSPTPAAAAADSSNPPAAASTGGAQQAGVNGSVAQKQPQSSNGGASSGTTTSRDDKASSPLRQGFASLLDKISHFLPALMRLRWDEAAVGEAMVKSYSRMRENWTQALSAASAKDVREAAEDARRPGFKPSAKTVQTLTVDERLRDALWKLRRTTPRPSSADFVVRTYGLTPADGQLLIQQGPRRFPSVHPRALEWATKLFRSTQHCIRCDVWTHSTASCPCTPSHVSQLPRYAKELARQQWGHRFTSAGRDTVDSPAAASTALDIVAERIERSEPFEDVLASLDALRETTTSADSRAALHLLASYRLKPSSVVPLGLQQQDQSTSAATKHARQKADARSTPALRRVRACLLTEQRRIREYRRVEQAVSILAAEFGGVLEPGLRAVLEEVKARQLFCFGALGQKSSASAKPFRRKPAKREDEVANPMLSLSLEAAPTKPKADDLLKRLPERPRLEPFSKIVNVLCRKCLDGGHSSSKCPRGEHVEAHDYVVARTILASVGLETEYLRSKDEGGVDARRALSRARSTEHKDRILAALLILGRADSVVDGGHLVPEVPFCESCGKLGHLKDDCSVLVDQALASVHVSPALVKLRPQLFRKLVVDPLFAQKNLNGKPMSRAFDMNRALEACKRGVPPRVSEGIEQIELTQVGGMPLAARFGGQPDELSLHLTPLAWYNPARFESILRRLGKPTAVVAQTVKHAAFPADAVIEHALGKQATDILRVHVDRNCVSLSDFVLNRTEFAQALRRVHDDAFGTAASGSLGDAMAQLNRLLRQWQDQLDDLDRYADSMKHQISALNQGSASQAEASMLSHILGTIAGSADEDSWAAAADRHAPTTAPHPHTSLETDVADEAELAATLESVQHVEGAAYDQDEFSSQNVATPSVPHQMREEAGVLPHDDAEAEEEPAHPPRKAHRSESADRDLLDSVLPSGEN